MHFFSLLTLSQTGSYMARVSLYARAATTAATIDAVAISSGFSASPRQDEQI